MNNRNKKAITFWAVIIAVTLAFIWLHSCMDMEDSAEESGFVYEIDGSLFYTDGGKGSKISGLSDDVLKLEGDRFLVIVECGSGDVFISTNGNKYTKYIRK